MSELLAWVLSTGSFAAIVLLTALAAKSFAGDAARGRRRCPRCWHELGPLPGEGSGEEAMQRSRHCSECGLAASLEKDTLRTRRRVGVGVLSIVGILAIVAAARIRSLDAGLWSMAPTRVLLLAAPFVDGSGYKSAQDELATRIASMQLDDALLHDAVDLVVSGDGGRPPGSARWSDSYDSVWSALIRALPRGDPLLLRFLEIPPNLMVNYLGAREGRAPLLLVDAVAWWPMGIESRLLLEFADGTVRRARFNPSSGTNQLLVEIPPDLGPGNRIRVVVSVRPLGAGDDAWREYPVVFTQIPEILGRAPKEPDAEPVDSPELQETVRSVFYPRSLAHGLERWFAARRASVQQRPHHRAGVRRHAVRTAGGDPRERRRAPDEPHLVVGRWATVARTLADADRGHRCARAACSAGPIARRELDRPHHGRPGSRRLRAAAGRGDAGPHEVQVLVGNHRDPAKGAARRRAFAHAALVARTVTPAHRAERPQPSECGDQRLPVDKVHGTTGVGIDG